MVVTAPRPTYVLGLDLGQRQDYSALTLDEIHARGTPEARHHARYLRRWPLNTAYPTIVDDVAALDGRPPLERTDVLAIDQTGVGRPVVDMLRQKQLRPVAITITGGDSVSAEGAFLRVPKRDLIGILQVLLQTERLKFARSLPDVPVLIQELESFRVKISPQTAHDSYEHREGQHDDLVLATAVAAWYAERSQPNLRLLGWAGMTYTNLR